MTNPYQPFEPSTNADGDGDEFIKAPDGRVTAAFWIGSICGATSWVTLGLAYRYAMEALYIGPPPTFAVLVVPATLLLGTTGCVLLSYGDRRRKMLGNHQWTSSRFFIATIATGAPTAFVLFSAMAG
ncbi:MAG: hypothetical protein HKN47_25640 [Pirellulaceae bacterium]|nr:hypothetical protein [Pirellulaceae bacterium]